MPAFLIFAMEKKILILGIGNTLLTDEGFGVHALHYLEEHYDWPSNVRLLDGATLGLMLMPEIMESDLVVILDIALGDKDAGTIYIGEKDMLGKALSLPDSLHQTDLKDIFISCELAGSSPDAVLFCLEPYEFQKVGSSLSDDAAARLPKFAAEVIEYLNAKNIFPQKKSH